VTYDDENGNIQAAIIDASQLRSDRVGKEIEIDDQALLTSTPYGIDWSVVFPDGIVIPSTDVQRVLYSNGIISLLDVLSNVNAVLNAVNSLTRLTSAKIVRYVRDTMEVTNDQL
jgi:hypothetical protein